MVGRLAAGPLAPTPTRRQSSTAAPRTRESFFSRELFLASRACSRDACECGAAAHSRYLERSRPVHAVRVSMVGVAVGPLAPTPTRRRTTPPRLGDSRVFFSRALSRACACSDTCSRDACECGRGSRGIARSLSGTLVRRWGELGTPISVLGVVLR